MSRITRAEDVKLGDVMKMGTETRKCHCIQTASARTCWAPLPYAPSDMRLDRDTLQALMDSGAVEVTRKDEPVVFERFLTKCNHGAATITFPSECEGLYKDGDKVKVTVERI